MGSYTRTGIMDCMLEEVVVCRATSCVTMPSGSMTQCNTWWASLSRFSVWQLTFINHKDFLIFFLNLLLFEIHPYFNKLHSFEVTMNHGPSLHTKQCFMPWWRLVHGLYAGECPLKLCIMKFEGTCPWAPTLAQVPLNSIMHSLKVFPYAKKLHVVNKTLLISITISCGTNSTMRNTPHIHPQNTVMDLNNVMFLCLKNQSNLDIVQAELQFR